MVIRVWLGSGERVRLLSGEEFSSTAIMAWEIGRNRVPVACRYGIRVR